MATHNETKQDTLRKTLEQFLTGDEDTPLTQEQIKDLERKQSTSPFFKRTSYKSRYRGSRGRNTLL